MAVGTTNAMSGPFTTNGATVAFPFTFTALSTDDVTVISRDADGEETTVSDALYTVTLGAESGGTVTFDNAPLSGATLFVLLDPGMEQETEFEQGGRYLAAAHNAALDRAALRDQALRRDVDRSIRAPVGETMGELPADRGGKFLAFDGAKNPIGASGTGSDAALREDLADEAMGGTLVNYRSRTVKSKLDDWRTPLDYGATGSGNETAILAAALASGKRLVLPKDYTFWVSGLTGFVNNQHITGDGCLKKYGATVEAMCLLPDEAEGIWFEGIEFDGNRGLFSGGNAVPGILGHLVQGFKASDVRFHDIIDAAIKLRNSTHVDVINNQFADCIENGCELQTYPTDPRTSLPWTGTHPERIGNYAFRGNRVERTTRLEDVGTGIVDACGFLFLSKDTNYRPRDVVVADNIFNDCLRSVWTEANVLGCEAENITITGNRVRNSVSGGTAEGIYAKGAIGLIGVRNVVASGNTIIDAGNYDAVGTLSSCFYVNGAAGDSTKNVRIVNNVLKDTTGDSLRTRHAVVANYCNGLTIEGNEVGGFRFEAFNISTAVHSGPEWGELDGVMYVRNLVVRNNPGAEADHSWANVTAYGPFVATDLAASATTVLLLGGVTGMVDLALPAPGRIVGQTVSLSQAAVSGTVQVKALADTVEQPTATIVNADFAGGRTAIIRCAWTETDQIAEGGKIASSITTASLSPATTVDAHVWIMVDHGPKQ